MENQRAPTDRSTSQFNPKVIYRMPLAFFRVSSNMARQTGWHLRSQVFGHQSAAL